MTNLIELKEFFVEGGHTERSHVLLHITEPNTNDEISRGYFFAIAELNRGDRRQIEALQHLISDFEQDYYSASESDIKHLFETTLETANRRSHHILNSPYSSIHCIFGAMRDNDIYFAYHGHPRAILYFGDHENIKSTPAVDENEIPNDRTQLFSTMLEGTLNPGDFFYITTPETGKLLDIDRIGKILYSRTLKQSTEHIERVLKDSHSQSSFGGIIFHYPKKNTPQISTGKMPNEMKSDSTESLRVLEKNENTIFNLTRNNPISSALSKIKSKATTNKIPSPTPPKFAQTNERPSDRHTNHKPKDSVVGIIFYSLGRALTIFFTTIYRSFYYLFKYSGRTLVFIFLIITNKDKKREDAVKSIKNAIETKKDKWRQTPTTTKIFLLLAIFLITSLIFSVLSIRSREAAATRQVAEDNKYQEILDKKNAAEAALIYGDETKALSLFSETKNLLQEFATIADPKNVNEKISVIRREMSDVTNRLHRIFQTEAEVFVDLSTEFPDNKITSIISLDNDLFAYGKDDYRLYKINRNSREISTIKYDPMYKFSAAAVPKEQDIILFVSGGKNIIIFDKKTNSLQNREISHPTSTVSISSVFVYSRRLYALDRENSVIWRHSETQTGYDRGTIWNKQNMTELISGTSIAIDGDMYVSLSSGQIIKLTSGELQPFTIVGLEPSLSSTEQIWTYNGLNNLYVLDQTGRRLIILDKTGVLRAQFISNSLQKPTGMLIDETNQTAYVIDSGKILKIKLTTN